MDREMININANIIKIIEEDKPTDGFSSSILF